MRNADATTEMLPFVVLDAKTPPVFAFMTSSSEVP
jgi:hypothetical protein